MITRSEFRDAKLLRRLQGHWCLAWRFGDGLLSCSVLSSG